MLLGTYFDPPHNPRFDAPRHFLASPLYRATFIISSVLSVKYANMYILDNFQFGDRRSVFLGNETYLLLSIFGTHFMTRNQSIPDQCGHSLSVVYYIKLFRPH